MKKINDKIKQYKNNVTIKNSIYLTISRFTRYGLMFIFTSFCAQYLGANDYGVISYNLSQVSLITLFFSLGADTYIVVQLSKHKDRNKTNSLISINLLNRILLITIVTITIIFLNTFINIYAFNFVAILIYATAIMDSFRTVSDGYFQSIQKLKYVALFEMIRAVSLLIGIIVVRILNWGILGVGSIYFITSLMIFLASFYLLFIRYEVRLKKIHIQECFILIKCAFPFFLSAIMVSLSVQVDTLMINNIAGNTQTAYYVTAKKIIDIVLMVPSIISMVILPRISSGEINKKKSSEVIKLIVVIGVAISIIVFATAKIIIMIAFGSEYILSYIIIRMFCISFPFLFINSFISTFLIGKGMQKKVLYVNTMGTICNIILNMFLIPKYMAIGAAVATIFTVFMNFVQFTIYFKKENFKLGGANE